MHEESSDYRVTSPLSPSLSPCRILQHHHSWQLRSSIQIQLLLVPLQGPWPSHLLFNRKRLPHTAANNHPPQPPTMAGATAVLTNTINPVSFNNFSGFGRPGAPIPLFPTVHAAACRRGVPRLFISAQPQSASSQLPPPQLPPQTSSFDNTTAISAPQIVPGRFEWE